MGPGEHASSVKREGNRTRKQRRETPEFAEFLAGIGARIVKLRETAGRTQQECSAEAGIDLRLWQRLEAGSANSTMLVFVDVARSLEVGVHQLTRPYTGKLPAPRSVGRPRKTR